MTQNLVKNILNATYFMCCIRKMYLFVQNTLLDLRMCSAGCETSMYHTYNALFFFLTQMIISSFPELAVSLRSVAPLCPHVVKMCYDTLKQQHPYAK